MAGAEAAISLQLNQSKESAPALDRDSSRSFLDDPEIPAFCSWKLIPVAFFAMMVTWSFGWLYIGETWDPFGWMGNIQIAILNCDNGLDPSYPLPPQILPIVQNQLLPVPFADQLVYNMAFNLSSPSESAFYWLNFTCNAMADAGYTGPGCGPYEQACAQEAREAIDDGHIWEVVYFNGNFTMDYLSWYTFATNPRIPGQYLTPGQNATWVNIYAQGRSFTTLGFVNAVFLRVFEGVKASVFGGLITVAQTGFALNQTFVNSATFNQPMKLVYENRAPVEFFGQNFGSYVFCIMLWLGSTFVCAVFAQYLTPAQIKISHGEEATSKEKVMGIALKAGFAFFYTFLLSVLMHCIMFALGKGNTAWHYNPGVSIAFGWFLSFSFVSINACLILALGPSRFSSISALLLVLQLTSGGAIFSEELSHRFFMIGKGLPFYYGVRGFRTYFYGTTENLLYINWLVIFAWNVVAMIAAITIVYFKQYKPVRRALGLVKEDTPKPTLKQIYLGGVMAAEKSKAVARAQQRQKLEELKAASSNKAAAAQ